MDQVAADVLDLVGQIRRRVGLLAEDFRERREAVGVFFEPDVDGLSAREVVAGRRRDGALVEPSAT
jgi:hypothetical protein